MKPSEAAKNALEAVLESIMGEKVLIICDYDKHHIGKAFAEGAINSGLWTRLVTLEKVRETRKELPDSLLEILGKKPNIFINLLRGSSEETPFRIKLIHIETRDKRARLAHCPGVTLDMLKVGALALTIKEHKEIQSFAQKLIVKLNRTRSLNISSPSGTCLSISALGRQFFTDTLIDWKNIKWMNFPTGEVIVAPVENLGEGHIVCDMAVGGIGPIRDKIELSVKDGKIQTYFSEDRDLQRNIKNSLELDEWSKTIGEFAFGINPKARFSKEFLEAEKILGTVHIAFGKNTDMPGGKNPSKNHIDFLISRPTVKAVNEKGDSVVILEDGRFKI